MKIIEDNVKQIDLGKVDSAAEFRKELEKLQQSNNELANEGEQSQSSESYPMQEKDETEEHDRTVNEPKAEDDGDNGVDVSDNADDDIGSDHLIPRNRFKKQIEKRKAAELAEMQERERRIRAETELQLINEALSKFSNPNQNVDSKSEEEWTPLDDEAHKHYSSQYMTLEQKLQKLETELQQNKVQAILNNQYNQFLTSNPDFKDSFNYLINKEKEYAETLLESKEDANAFVLQKMNQIARHAVENGKNAAEIFYKMARVHGFQKKSNTPSTNINAIQNNMKKSARADVNSMSIPMGNGAENYTTLSEFEKFYKSADKESVSKFHELLRKAKR